MSLDLDISAPLIEPLRCDLLDRHNICFNILRLDTIHPTIHGNKWYKLKRNLRQFQTKGVSRVLSFGGAYSNHLYALAAAGEHFSLETIGLVRGEIVEPLNPVLKFAKDRGMTLIPLSRTEYRHKHEESFLAKLQDRLGPFQLLPEGGSNLLAVQGCEEIAESIRWQSSSRPRIVALCCGTGATMAGIVAGLSHQSSSNPAEVLGISVLKGEGYLQGEVRKWLEKNHCQSATNWRVEENYHCGGYAKTNPGLKAFLESFSTSFSLPLEPVYTGKLIYALFNMIKEGVIPDGVEIIAIHTGGIY
ncbi:MAG: 1-aminocyclopropane-1-carboxylate deaminase [SAR86 cluster bacterium]|uniref:1-aminocyclopropane-1-carboxylate deaminase n=1 Tax=SAR86 cluster bacterium TaxID=2030880 RepID=A0A2A5BAN0_9GAMM|nr:MAG: 1-aminocyclopropane-1-carboxylate deaminase [SAR86 cluster bacterium]